MQDRRSGQGRAGDGGRTRSSALTHGGEDSSMKEEEGRRLRSQGSRRDGKIQLRNATNIKYYVCLNENEQFSYQIIVISVFEIIIISGYFILIFLKLAILGNYLMKRPL